MLFYYVLGLCFSLSKALRIEVGIGENGLDFTDDNQVFLGPTYTG